MMTLTLKPRGSAGRVSLSEDKILANNVYFPWEYNPRNIKLWLVCDEHGPKNAVWGVDEGEALDALVDSGLGDWLLVPSDQVTGEEWELSHYTPLGNGGELCDLTDIQVQEVDLKRLEVETCKLLVFFARAVGASSG